MLDVSTEAAIRAAIKAELGREGPLLPILHRIQHGLGHVPDAALPMIAEALGIGRAEVHGAMSFYPDFLTEPRDGPVVKLCRAEACQARGAARLALAASALPAGVTVEPVYCLGLCANGPAAMVDGRLLAAVTPDKLAEALT